MWRTGKIAAVFGTYRTDRAGMPYNVVPSTQHMVPINYDQYRTQSDPGPFPFPGPDTGMIQGGDPTCSRYTDCHVLVAQQGTCMLYEGWACHFTNGRWYCGSGAKWDMKRPSYGQRPIGWTSADAAGMPITPGVLKYSEAASGTISHALRVAVGCMSWNYIRPASHGAAHPACGSDLSKYPPLGLRIRLKSSFDISRFKPINQTILRALKKYGAFITDNNPGTMAPVLYGDVDARWRDTLYELWTIPASNFEAIITYQ